MKKIVSEKEKRKEGISVPEDYLCLSCGNHFTVAPSEEQTCSRCGSANTLKLNQSGLVGFPGSGGG
jgi:DNA-directed RNA polymerase subunit RPC12/RpoP